MGEGRARVKFMREQALRVAALFWALPFVLAGTGALADPAPVPKVKARTPISVAGKQNVSTVRLSRLRTTILPNERLGELQDGPSCKLRGTISMQKKVWQLAGRAASRGFYFEMQRAGYPRPGQTESLFEEKPRVPEDFEIGMMVRKMQVSLCTQSGENWGGVYVEAKWELFSKRARKVVFDTVTEGSFQNDGPEKTLLSVMFERAFAAATRNMLAERQFADYVTGAIPLPAAEVLAASELVLRGPPHAPEGGVARNATLLRAAVVTIETGSSTGSGFFISPEGYLLTNHHVVGNVKFVKVKLATGRELVGEVLKTDRRRDVALLKTEAVGVEPLSIRDSDPNIGEDVFAVGSPLGDRFSGSFTRGVLSGHRSLGELRYLQSDVAVLPGNSGGPLLDGSGAVVGISARALDSGRANLNLFIPIDDALATLAVRVRN